jgi:hypothetical protein
VLAVAIKVELDGAPHDLDFLASGFLNRKFRRSASRCLTGRVSPGFDSTR